MKMNEPKKTGQANVLHVIDHFGFGGAQTIVNGLLHKWEPGNINLSSYALRKSNNNQINVDNKKLFFTSSHKSKYDVLSFFELKKFIDANNVGILHLHLVKSIFFGILIKQIYHKDLKIIVHEHGKVFKDIFWYNNLLRLFQSSVDLFIAISETTKKRLIENAGIKESKIKVLYNFVDLEHFDPQKIEISKLEEREKLGLNDDDFILGFAGRHVERKGCRDLIFALKDLEQFKNIKLFIAGDGPKKEEYKNLANNPNIFFLGFVPDIRWLYSIIDCFVIPSHWEPLGIVVLEAHAMGIPVIATNVEGLNEVILDDKTGFLFEPKNKTDLAKKIELLSHNENLRIELTKNGLKNVGKYSLNNYLTKLEEIYRGL